MPYPQTFADLDTDRAAGNPNHVADHKLIAQNLNAIAHDLIEAIGTEDSLADKIARLAQAISDNAAAISGFADLGAGAQAAAEAAQAATETAAAADSAASSAVETANLALSPTGKTQRLVWNTNAVPTDKYPARDTAKFQYAQYVGPTDPAAVGRTLIDGDDWLNPNG